MNNNGDVTFNGPFSEYLPKPFPLEEKLPIIAPFWTDFDTRCKGSGNVSYQETTSNSIRVKAANDIQSSLSLSSAFYPSSVIIVTWDQVQYYNCYVKNDTKVRVFVCIYTQGKAASLSQIPFACFRNMCILYCACV